MLKWEAVQSIEELCRAEGRFGVLVLQQEVAPDNKEGSLPRECLLTIPIPMREREADDEQEDSAVHRDRNIVACGCSLLLL